MSCLTALVFLVALAVISIDHAGAKRPKCQGKASSNNKWAGVCFGTNKDLNNAKPPRLFCDTLVGNNSYPAPGCPEGKPTCCVDCQKQNKFCRKRWSHSIGRRICCPSELKIGEGKPQSNCICCKQCKRKRACRRKSKESYCFTKFGSCTPGWKVYKNLCKGFGCWCCVPPK